MKRLLLLLAVSLPVAYIPLQAGCNAQSEGQLCSPLNGDLDCATGLACKAQSGVSGSVGVCCSDGSTNAACVSNGTTTSTTTTTTTTTTTGTGGTGGMGTGGMGTGGMGTGGTGTGGSGTGGTDGGTSDAGDGG